MPDQDEDQVGIALERCRFVGRQPQLSARPFKMENFLVIPRELVIDEQELLGMLRKAEPRPVEL